MLTKCSNCEFYLFSKERFCRNCGISSPTEDFQYTSDHLERNLTIILTLISAMVCGFGLVLLRNDGDFSSLSELPAALLLSLAFCFPISYLFVTFVLSRLTKKEWRRRFAYQKVDVTLNEIQDTIMVRNYELDEKYREIEELLARTNDVQNAEVKEKLKEARLSVAAQIARYQLHHLKIDLVRLQNRLLPIFYERNVSENKDGFLDEVDEALLEIKNTRQSLTDDYAIEFPESISSEKQDFLLQLDETKASCEKLRESLLNQRAAVALQNFSPLEDNLKLSNASDLHYSMETFNIQTAITDFSESFEELERQYKRLKAEDGSQFSLD